MLIPSRLRPRAAAPLSLGLLLATLAPVSPVAAQTPNPVPASIGPGIPKITYTADQLFKPIGNVRLRTGNNIVYMHKGYLAIVFAGDHLAPSGGIAFVDIGDPKKPVVVSKKDDADTKEIVENHGWGMTRWQGRDYAAIQSQYGAEIWDWTDIQKPTLVKRVKCPGLGGGGYDNAPFSVFWMAPYIYVAGGGHGIFVIDAKDVNNPVVLQQIPKSKIGNFNIGNLYGVGNVLVASTMGLGDNVKGYAFFDLSNPEKPQLMAVPQNAPQTMYSAHLNGNRMYAAGNRGHLYIHDITDPLNIKEISAVKYDGAGEYILVQDDVVHFGLRDNYHRVQLGKGPSDPATFVVQKVTGVGDHGFCVPMGNLVMVTDDHGSGTTLVPHQMAPDNTGASVNMVRPLPEAKNVAVTSPIGVTLTDMVDMMTVDSSSFLVRPVGGQPLKGRYSGQTSILNFVPEKPLSPNTVYEVVLEKGKVKDIAGNPMPAEFKSRFTTGSALPTAVGSLPRREGSPARAGLWGGVRGEASALRKKALEQARKALGRSIRKSNP